MFIQGSLERFLSPNQGYFRIFFKFTWKCGWKHENGQKIEISSKIYAENTYGHLFYLEFESWFRIFGPFFCLKTRKWSKNWNQLENVRRKHLRTPILTRISSWFRIFGPFFCLKIRKWTKNWNQLENLRRKHLRTPNLTRILSWFWIFSPYFCFQTRKWTKKIEISS